MATSNIMQANNWRSAFRLADFMAADVATVAGQYNKLGQFIVPAGTQVGLGWGDLHGQQDADGRIYVDLQDAAGVATNGQFQIAIYDPSDHPMMILDEYRTEQVRTTATDRSKQVPFPFSNVFASRDKKICLYFKPDVAVTVSASKSTVLFDITKTVGV